MTTITSIMRSPELCALIMTPTASGPLSRATEDTIASDRQLLEEKLLNLNEALCDAKRLPNNGHFNHRLKHLGKASIYSTIHQHCQKAFLVEDITDKETLYTIKSDIQLAAVAGDVLSQMCVSEEISQDVLRALAICVYLSAYGEATGWDREYCQRVKMLREGQYNGHLDALFNESDERAKLATNIAGLPQEMIDTIFDLRASDVLPVWAELDCENAPVWHKGRATVDFYSLSSAPDGLGSLTATLVAGLASITPITSSPGFLLDDSTVPEDLLDSARKATLRAVTLVTTSSFPTHPGVGNPHMEVIPASIATSYLSSLRHLHIYMQLHDFFDTLYPAVIYGAQTHLPSIKSTIPHLRTLHLDLLDDSRAYNLPLRPWYQYMAAHEYRKGETTFEVELEKLVAAMREIEGVKRTVRLYYRPARYQWYPEVVQERDMQDARHAKLYNVVRWLQAEPGEVLVV